MPDENVRYPIEMLDTRAPWMKIALREEGAAIRELPAKDGFADEVRLALVLDAGLTRSRANFDKAAAQPFGARPQKTFGLNVPSLGNPAMRAVSEMERSALDQQNKGIVKYFDGVKSDPSYDKKGRSYDIAPSHGSADGHARVTAWCAAFVNWCLGQAGAPRLGYATARSWLEFGQPIAWPVYGCITVVRPSADTGSTTGHVAFYCGEQGNRVELLGGNQGDRVCKSKFKASSVLGYRWPTDLKYYLDSVVV